MTISLSSYFKPIKLQQIGCIQSRYCLVDWHGSPGRQGRISPCVAGPALPGRSTLGPPGEGAAMRLRIKLRFLKKKIVLMEDIDNISQLV